MVLTNVDLDRIDGNSGTFANVNTVSLNGRQQLFPVKKV